METILVWTQPDLEIKDEVCLFNNDKISLVQKCQKSSSMIECKKINMAVLHFQQRSVCMLIAPSTLFHIVLNVLYFFPSWTNTTSNF